MDFKLLNGIVYINLNKWIVQHKFIINNIYVFFFFSKNYKHFFTVLIF